MEINASGLPTKPVVIHAAERTLTYWDAQAAKGVPGYWSRITDSATVLAAICDYSGVSVLKTKRFGGDHCYPRKPFGKH